MKFFLVTGATGFIGRRLLPRLVGDDRAVRVMVRDPVGLPLPLGGQVEIVHGGLGDPDAADRAMRGVTHVLHLAALATACARDDTQYDRLNAAAVQVLLSAAARHRVTRFVHVSSMAALAPLAPTRAGGASRRSTPYARSKVASEDLVHRYVAAGHDAVIVRPTRVYGPGPWNDANGTTRLIAMYLNGNLRIRLRDGDVRSNYVHVDDVARGIELAALHGRCGAAYNLGGENASLRGFFAAVAEVSAVRRVMVPIAPGAVLPVAVLAKAWCRLGGRTSLTPEWLDYFLEDRPVDSDMAREDLGYDPLPLRDGLRRTIAWLQDQEKGPWHVPVLQHA
ncbi:MAG: NAD-dependent epimerase/dehydratase family protein [Krumholzibacteria bacterium]|nr:NAD-dependent epimerase/dehydratase family protein [Candidatus Krumholzibacteria bacterium]